MEWRELIPSARAKRFWTVAATTFAAGMLLVAGLYAIACGCKGLADWIKDKRAPLAESAAKFSGWYDGLSWQAWAIVGMAALVVCNALVAGYRVWSAEERGKNEIDAFKEKIPGEVDRRIKSALDGMTITTSTGPLISISAAEGRIAELSAENEKLRKRRADEERVHLSRKLCVGAGRELEAALANVEAFSRLASWAYRFPRFVTEVFAISSSAPAEVLAAFAKADRGDARKAQMALVRIAHDTASRLNAESLAADFDPVDGDWNTWAPAKEYPYRASGSLRESIDDLAIKINEAALAVAPNTVSGEQRLDTVRGGCDLLLDYCDMLRDRARMTGSANMQPASEFSQAVTTVLAAVLKPDVLRIEHAAFDAASDLAFAASPPQPIAALQASRVWLEKFRDRVNEPMLRERFLALERPGEVAE